MPSLLSFIFVAFCLGVSFSQNTLQFGQVLYNLTFPPNTDYVYFQVDIPYNASTPRQLRTAILSYSPYYELNVSASFSSPFPNNTNNEYFGTNKDGSYMRGLVWISDLPTNDATLYIGVSRASVTDGDVTFGLNIEWPEDFTQYQDGIRFQTEVPIKPWQTKWYWVPYHDQAISGFRGEFCDEADAESISMSLVFPETNSYDDDEFLNPCACSDYIVEDRTVNILTTFAQTASHMFLIAPGVADAAETPLYISVYYAGLTPDATCAAAYTPKPTCAQRTRNPARTRSYSPEPTAADPPFTVRLTLWQQEQYPSVLTKFTKPDRIDDDLIANIHDTPYCDFWSYDNFTAYVAKGIFGSFDSSCFLERNAGNFTRYKLSTLLGAQTQDRVLRIEDFYKSDRNDTFFNIVHHSPNCGSYAYFHTAVPTQGWRAALPPGGGGEVKKEWTPAAVGVSVIFAFLFSIFFISTILLVIRLREYTRYRKI